VILNELGASFEGVEWPVLATPRALDPEGPGGLLHAKAVVADDEAVFITSASLTEAISGA
jgi:phosphatidylserine/phosphatidylglycerophosphate/cardiolipin synthase-like enzyme